MIHRSGCVGENWMRFSSMWCLVWETFLTLPSKVKVANSALNVVSGGQLVYYSSRWVLEMAKGQSWLSYLLTYWLSYLGWSGVMICLRGVFNSEMRIILWSLTYFSSICAFVSFMSSYVSWNYIKHPNLSPVISTELVDISSMTKKMFWYLNFQFAIWFLLHTYVFYLDSRISFASSQLNLS